MNDPQPETTATSRPGAQATTPHRRLKRAAGLLASGALLAPAAAAVQLVNAPEAHADAWRDAQYWLEDYGITEAWETTEGDDVTIAILDSGVDGDHPTLEDAVVDGYDVSGGGDGSGGPVEQMSTEHGTLVASLAAGRGHEPTGDEPDELPDPDEYDDFTDEDWEEWWDELLEELEDMEEYGQGAGVLSGEALLTGTVRAAAHQAPADGPRLDLTASSSVLDFSLPASRGAALDTEGGQGSAGVVGVAPEADLLSVSMALEMPNQYGPDMEEQVVDAIYWAVDEGADILNMSFGLPNQQEWPEEWDEAFMHAVENDVLVVAAAGNRISGHWSVGAPATIPGVLTVAGVDEDQEISEDASTQGIAIDMAAPSEPLVGAAPDGLNAQWSGTSGAAPIVAGAAALVWSAHPELSAEEVKHRLLQTAESVGDDDEIDPEFGHGILDVAAAVESDDVPEYEAADYETLEEWIRVHRREDSEAGGHEDIPADAGVEAGPDGDPRERPQASEARVMQDWAGPTVLGVAGLLVVSVLVIAAVHLSSRRKT